MRSGHSGPAWIELRKRTIFILGLSALLLFLLARAPASLLWRWVGPMVPELHLVQVSGTLWRGQASDAYFRDISLGPVQWRWQPLAVLRARWSNHVEMGAAPSVIEADVGRSLTGSLFADDVMVRMPVETLIGRYLPPDKRPPVAVEGQLEAEIADLVYRDRTLETLQGELRLSALSIAGVRYGDALAGLGAADNAILLDVAMAPDAPVQLEGALRLSTEGDYELNLTFEDPSTLGSSADALIRSLASRTRDQRWRLQWKGRL